MTESCSERGDKKLVEKKNEGEAVNVEKKFF